MLRFIVFLGLIFSLGILPTVTYAESWHIFLNPYEGPKKTELFSPAELPISLGDSVIWVNQDSDIHEIVSGVPNHPDYSGEYFSTGELSIGDEFTEVFDDNSFAAYYYFCKIHPWYTGKIFFQDREGIYNSTLDISYTISESETLHVTGLVESDVAKTAYEVLIYDDENNLVFQKLDLFKPDASFDVFVDIPTTLNPDEIYLLKLVYGVPSESTELLLDLPSHYPKPIFDDIFGWLMDMIQNINSIFVISYYFI